MDKNEQRRIAKIKRFERRLIEEKQIKEYFESKKNTESLIENISQLSQEDKDNLLKNICVNKAATIEDVDILLSFGAKINEEEHTNAFTLSCGHNKQNIVKYFLDNGFKHQESINVGFRSACAYGIVPLADLLLKHNVEINYDDGKPFINACQCNNYEMVDFLIKKGADVNAQNGKSLIYACANNYINIAKLLLDNNADVHVQDEKPLAFALRNENENLIQLLQNYGANKGNMKHKFQKEIYSFHQLPKAKSELAKLAQDLKKIMGSAEDDLKAPQLIPPDRNFKFEKFLQLHILNYLKENDIELDSNKIIKKIRI